MESSNKGFYTWFTIFMISEIRVASLWFNKTAELEAILEDDEKVSASSIDEQLKHTLLQAAEICAECNNFKGYIEMADNCLLRATLDVNLVSSASVLCDGIGEQNFDEVPAIVQGTAQKLKNGWSLGNAETSTEVLVEYDILLTLEQYAAMQGYETFGSRRRRVKRSASRATWPNATVKFKIYPMMFSSKELKLLRIAMTQWEHFTCLKFKEATEADEHFLQFRTGYAGCSSHLGFAKIGKQNVNLKSPGCSFVRVYLHEIGHAIGLYHEHNRPDRDKYIRINWKSLESGKNNSDFRKNDPYYANTFGLEYDYKSIMHYGSGAYSIDGNWTIRAVNKENDKLIQQANRELQFKDVQVVNMMYKCNVHCPTNIRCRDGGFVNKECTCFCRDGTNSCQESEKGPTKHGKECNNTIRDDLCEKHKLERGCWRDALSVVPKCRKTCGICGKTMKGGSQHAKGNCKNPLGDEQCSILANAWYCHLVPAYMVVNCPQACGWCNRKDMAGICENLWSSKDCDMFANFGYCRLERAWMLAHCRKSCKACDIVDKTCVNEHKNEAECYAWAVAGECHDNIRWMYKNCRLACGRCGDLPGAQCRDIHSPKAECKRSAHAGSCTEFFQARFMMENCLGACNQILQERCPGIDCTDDTPKCESWAKLGECYMNPRFMMTSCSKSCSENMCPKWEPENHCSNKLSEEECWRYVSHCGVRIKANLNCYKMCSGCGNDGAECVNQVSDDRCWSSKVLGKCEASENIRAVCYRSCSGCGGDADKGKECLDTSSVCKAKKLTGLCDHEPESMLKLCKKTCGFCDQGNYVEAVKFSKSRFCKDELQSKHVDRCKDFFNDGQCPRNQWVRDNCKRTCGRCVECYNNKPDVYCDKIKKDGRCTDLTMKAQCERSCGVCKPKGEPRTVSTHSCIDKYPSFYCKHLSSLSTGCKRYTTKRDCAKTCGACGEKTTSVTNTPKDSRKKTGTTLEESGIEAQAIPTLSTKLSPTAPTIVKVAVTAVKHTIPDFCLTATNIKTSNKRDNPDYTCRVWAAKGHCKLNSVTKVCKKTCECDQCYDVDQTQCRQEAAKGSCNLGSAVLRKWMEKRCAKTCRLCNGDIDRTLLSKQAISTSMQPHATTMRLSVVNGRASKDCSHLTNLRQSKDQRNPDRKCKEWSAGGHCGNNFMEKNCVKTCTCETCFDVDQIDCRKKKSAGRCNPSNRNFNWMKRNCAKTCGKCGKLPGGMNPENSPYGYAVNTLRQLVCEAEHCHVRKWNESCCDKTSDCAALADVACSTSSMITDKCPVSCGLCTPTCVDHVEWGSFDCQENRHWCNDNRYEVLKAALEFCPLTCGYCNPCTETVRF